MSDEVDVSENNRDSITSEDSKQNVEAVAVAGAEDAERASSNVPEQPVTTIDGQDSIKSEVEEQEQPEQISKEEEQKCGVKRRASEAFSESGNDEFKGFDHIDSENPVVEYTRVLERMESEVQTAIESFTPVKHVIASSATHKASKRPRKDTDGSRPNSALSSRSEGDGMTSSTDVGSAASSPASRGKRTEVASAQYRVPLEHGWRRELVFRAALDPHARRNSDIYYYTPQGKKLRSMREISEHLSGTGLTIDNFTFFKEALGVDDPEKEIIRDARMMRRVESPVSHPLVVPVEGKRTPKPKAPKGASPEPPTIKSPPAKIKVKSFGSRLNNNSSPSNKPLKKTTTPSTDNNNSAAWKKPRQPPPTASATPVTPVATVTSAAVATAVTSVTPVTPVPPPLPPPPLQSRPPPPSPILQTSPDMQPSRQMLQPCSMSCGDGAVPSLACDACLCLYHPACAGYAHVAPQGHFLCKNCRKSNSPPLEPPPLTHKSGVQGPGVARRLATTLPRQQARSDRRVLLRMKVNPVAGGGPHGERVWAVAKPSSAPRPPVVRPALPQSIAILNGRRFIVVPRAMPHDAKK